MKKTTIISAFFALAALASCTKEFSPELQGQKVTITVAEDALKSAYLPDEQKIKLTGDETMAVFYEQSDDEGKFYGAAKSGTNPLQTTLTGTNKYSVTLPGEASNVAKLYGVFPYSQAIVRTNSGHTGFYLRLSPIQLATTTSFDPHMDYIVTQPFTLEEGSATVTSVKRLFAPLKVTVAGLDPKEKIYSATLKVNAEPEKADLHHLAGVFYFAMKDAYASTKLTSSEQNSITNAVTAIYPNGLKINGNGYDIWYMVNATSFEAGTSVTLVVTTEKRTIEKTLQTSSPIEIKNDCVNKLWFPISEPEKNEYSLTTSFLNKNISNNSTKPFVASDGNSYSWAFTGGSMLFDSVSSDKNDYGTCLRITGADASAATIMIPTIEGKKVLKARLFTHPLSAGDSKATTFSLVNDADEVLATYGYNLYKNAGDYLLGPNGGYMDVVLPDGVESLSGLRLKSVTANNKLITAITLFVDSEVEIEEEEEGGDQQVVDYYQEFMDGKDLVIGSKTYNKSQFDSDKIFLVNSISATSNGHLIKEGITFIGWDDDNPDNNIHSTTNNISMYGNIVLVGRYSNKKPVINTNSVQIQLSNGTVAWKNIEFTSQNGTASMNTKGKTEDGLNFIADDCVLKCAGSLIRDSTAPFFDSFEIYNSRVYAPCNGNAMFHYTNSTKKAKIGTMKNFILKNNVLVGNATLDKESLILQMQTTNTEDSKAVVYPDLNIKIENNTCINFRAGQIIKAPYCKTLNLRNNVFVSDIAKSTAAVYILGMNIGGSAAGPDLSQNLSKIVNNYGYKTAGEQALNLTYDTVKNYYGDNKGADNIFDNYVPCQSNPLDTEHCDAEKLIFPVIADLKAQKIGSNLD